ncbi:putative transcription factor Spt20 [Helianthus annuus]|nr:putative transcription factor Spt20 [Helianthus annuus]
MGVSFKVSKKGTRFRPKPKPQLLTHEHVDPPSQIHTNQSVISTPKPSVDVTENKKDDAEISDADISFFINLFPDGYSIGNPSENRANQATVQDDPKFLHPYDRTSESMFTAIERGLLPADFLDDIPCKYVNGTVACVVRDYRNCGLEAGVNGSSADSSTPITSKIRLKMSLENVVKDMHLISNSSWTYGDLMVSVIEYDKNQMQYGAPSAMGSSQRDKSAVTSVLAAGGVGSITNNAQLAGRRSNSVPQTPAISGVGSPASVGNVGGPFNAASPLVGKDFEKTMRDKFSKIELLTVRHQLNVKKNKVDEYKETTTFPTQQLNHFLYNDQNNENPKDEDCKMPLSKSLVGGSMNVCKTRVLNFKQDERVLQGNGYVVVPKSRTRMILSEKRDDGTVAMHYGELDDYDYSSVEEYLPTLPNTHVADLLAAQFCTLIIREGYEVEGDHLQPKPTNIVRSSGDQPNNNASVITPKVEIPESVSGQPSNEIAKPTDSGPNNNNGSVNSSGARMHPPANSQPLQIPQGGLPARPMQPDSQPSFQQNPHLMQQQLQRSSAMMLGSNPLSQLNAMGQNSNMQQLGHMLNKPSALQLQMLQQQQPLQMQRKMMMGLGNAGNNMVGLQGMGNMMGGTRGISPQMTGAISGMGNNMGQNPMSMSQASNFSNMISQHLRSGQISPAQAAIMTTKLRMTQNRNMLGGAAGQSGNITGLTGANRQVHPGSGNYSMLGPNMNRGNNINNMNMNPMQRTNMAPPKLISGMNAYMNPQQQQQQLPQQQMPHQQLPQQQQMPHQQLQQQQQESTSPLQAVLSPPQQVGSPSMGLPPQQQASPQQMSARTPMSPQLSSGTIQPPMSAGNQEANCPASPQLSSQTMGSVSSMANSPMDMQGVNKSS